MDNPCAGEFKIGDRYHTEGGKIAEIKTLSFTNGTGMTVQVEGEGIIYIYNDMGLNILPGEKRFNLTQKVHKDPYSQL